MPFLTQSFPTSKDNFFIHFIVIIENHFTCSWEKLSSNVKDFQHVFCKILVYLLVLIDKTNRTKQKKKKRKVKPG